MKIADIEELYARGGFNEVKKDYRDLVDAFRHLRCREPIPNSDYLHGLYLTDLMFRSTSENIRILSGMGESNWLRVLRDSLTKALERIKTKKGFLKAIFVGTGAPSKAILYLQNKFGTDTVKFITATAPEPVEHFIACDSHMLRLEKAHPPITGDMDSSKIIASVYLYNPARAKAKEEQFELIWKDLETQ